MAPNNTPVDFEKLIEALEKFIPEILPKGQTHDIKQLAEQTAEILKKMFDSPDNKLTVDKLADPELINRVTDTVNLLVDIKSNPALVEALRNAPDKLADPAFFNQLSVAIKLNATIKNSKDLTGDLSELFKTLSKDNEKFNAFAKDLKELLNKPDKSNIKEDFKKLLFKHFSALEHGKIRGLLEKINHDLKMKTPEMKGQKKTQVDDPYVNLLGMLNSAFTGGYAVPQFQDMGNALAIPDMNPYNDNTNIGRDNSVNFCWGDSFGKEEKASNRMESLGSVFTDILQNVGIQMGAPSEQPTNSPSPLSTSPKPPGTIT